MASPLSLDPYDSSSSSDEATDSSVFGPNPSELPSAEKPSNMQFSFEDTNSNVAQSRLLNDRKVSSYGDSGISHGVFDNEDSELRTLIS